MDTHGFWNLVTHQVGCTPPSAETIAEAVAYVQSLSYGTGEKSAMEAACAYYGWGMPEGKPDYEETRTRARAAGFASNDRQPWGLFYLGVCRYQGQGIRRNRRDAFYTLKWSARLGNALAQCDLGLMYLWGHGVRQSNRKAAANFKKAADQSVPQGLFLYAHCLASGTGCAQNLAEARTLCQQAAAMGHFKAADMLAKLPPAA